MNKKTSRLRRARKGRCHSRRLSVPRLSVHRTSQHIYAQIIMPDGKVAAAASTVEKDFREQKKSNIDAANKIGELIGERAVKAKITKVAFDRSGFKYHGRIKALADGARKSGLEF